MLELRLHGSLGRDFGKIWNLEVSTPREAINAICAMKPGFRAAVLKLDQSGFVFKVKTKKEDLIEEDLPLHLEDKTRVDVVPIVRGSGAAARIIVGVVLVAVGAYIAIGSSGTQAFIGKAIAGVGISLIVGGVVQLLSPQPKRVQFNDDVKSWTINGPLNTTDQGNPIPVVYGEVLTGGVPISAGLTTGAAVASESDTPSAEIGGDLDEVYRFGTPVTAGQVVLNFSVSPHNLANARTYSWSITGMPGSTLHSIAGQGTATVQITITYNIPTATISTDSYVVTCNISGESTNSQMDGVPPTVHATATATGTITLDTRAPSW